MAKELKRSNKDKVIAGVCGGLAEYLEIDVTIIRLGVIFIALSTGAGILAYIIAALVIPSET